MAIGLYLLPTPNWIMLQFGYTSNPQTLATKRLRIGGCPQTTRYRCWRPHRRSMSDECSWTFGIFLIDRNLTFIQLTDLSLAAYTCPAAEHGSRGRADSEGDRSTPPPPQHHKGAQRTSQGLASKDPLQNSSFLGIKPDCPVSTLEHPQNRRISFIDRSCGAGVL